MARRAGVRTPRWPLLPSGGLSTYRFRLDRLATVASDFGNADCRWRTKENQPLR